EDGNRAGVARGLGTEGGFGAIDKAHGDTFRVRLFEAERDARLGEGTFLEVGRTERAAFILRGDLPVELKFGLGFILAAYAEERLAELEMGGGMARIEGERLLEGIDGFIPVAKIKMSEAELKDGGGLVGVEVAGGLERLQCFLEAGE